VLLALAAAGARADTAADLAPAPVASDAQAPGSSGVRPQHIWTAEYAELLWGDTGMVLSSPAHWDQEDWTCVAFSAAGIGAAAALDNTVKDRVQAQRSTGEYRFFKEYQNLGSTWSFGVIGAFEAWGELTGDATAKNTAMDALAASIIGPGLVGTGVKYAAGRVRPNTASRTFEFRPFSGNQSFPSGHAAQAFAVATAIAGNYPSWWVQTLCYGGAGLVAYARVEQNAHYASDVVAGALLGWSVGRAVVRRHSAPPDPRRLTWTPYATASGFGLVCLKEF
jgi:membrane-associated phospholipid phosphatase